MTNMSAIEELEQSLGTDGLSRFLESSIPLFRNNLAELLKALEQQQWEEAADIAHKMQASALIFSTRGFNDSLDNIRKQDKTLIETSAFKMYLIQQTKYSLQQICAKYQIDI
ncbi:MAG: Unknown protein [uncultured Thiotrichaceae bacterium]|uniref:HPt domain-containing protein n=1 Tax=uncultured Thiotrichaceae bacterium TaxID=298394 RepID=A0A6S6UJP8_9GAMM|nr:MAG: Unknown protein [uncultured Thiotrichaceae bacterium]